MRRWRTVQSPRSRAGGRADRIPLLNIATRGDTTAGVVLLLHGGRVESRSSVRRVNLSVVRMRMFAPSILAAGGDGIAVALLRNRYRGWNGYDADPVADALWALNEIERRHGPVPVVIVGHSMGGRAALRAAGEPRVRGVVALAPWLPADEPIAQLAGRSVLIAHGARDSVTSPDRSLAYVRRAADVANRVCFWRVPGGRHAMLERPAHWHNLVRDFALGVLEIRPLTQDLTDAFDAGALELCLGDRATRRRHEYGHDYGPAEAHRMR